MLDETKWRVNQGKWSDVDSTVADSPRHPEKDCNQSFYSDRNACGAQAVVAHIFFDATLEELIGEMVKSQISFFIEMSVRRTNIFPEMSVRRLHSTSNVYILHHTLICMVWNRAI